MLLAAAGSGGVGAFGEAGHRVVGTVAEIHLRGSRAIQEVRRILRPNETLAEAAVWPDRIKSPTYEDGDTGPFRLEHPAHEVYHYTNVPFQLDRYDPAAPGAHWIDVVTMARESIRVLAGSSTVFTRREALRLLAHFAGDMHQPLHVGNGYVAADPPFRFVVPKGPIGWRTTLGGNALRYGPNDNFNLHSYWDSHVVNLAMQRQDVATYAAAVAGEKPPPAWRNEGRVETWPEQWATEGLDLARQLHAGLTILEYLGPDEDRGTPHRWRIAQPPGYDDFARPRVRTQLAKGGYRLAATLQAIWK
jgi:hypothetical protein